MDYPKIKKDYPCGRQCKYIVRNTPWTKCKCSDKLVIVSKGSNITTTLH